MLVRTVINLPGLRKPAPFFYWALIVGELINDAHAVPVEGNRLRVESKDPETLPHNRV